MEKQFYVYILTNKVNGTLYVGMTSDLIGRTGTHKTEFYDDAFAKKYKLKTLVYFETFSDPENAIKREKKLKKWSRQWKLNIINEFNPEWDDLYETICQ